MPTDRTITYAQAVNEALDGCLAADPAVYLMGLGVPDPKGVFGTTAGLRERYGERARDMPCAENGMTGIALGSALVGMRPVLCHQRLDFALLALEQMVNQAANWHYMFGGQARLPLVIRMIIGRGWGQGPQHSQSLQAWFAHVPGLKVVMPTTPRDAKGLLIAAIEDDNPVIYLEHRWLHGLKDEVPSGQYRTDLGRARVIRRGDDVTLVGVSYMTLECLQAAEVLADDGIAAEVVDLRTLRPWDSETVVDSVARTGRLLVADTGWTGGGFAGEVVAKVTEEAFDQLRCAPRRVALPDCPTPTSPALSGRYYPRAMDIVAAVRRMFGRGETPRPEVTVPLDVPALSFTGPF